jgi:TolB-like protein/DNA-binding winged helix-turn-helix (wHTH) protein/Flp pilus assembly protein TadD
MNRQAEAERDRCYCFGPFRLDASDRRLYRDGAEIPLTPKAFDLLLALVEGAGRLRTRQSLIEALWPDTVVEEHGLTWNVSALRKALGDTGDAPRYVETVRGHGYRFIAEVRRAAIDDDDAPPPEPAAAEPPARVEAPAAAAQARAHPEASPSPRARASAWRSPLRLAFAIVLAIAALAAGLAPLLRATAPGAPPPHSVAVLPFDNLSADPASSYFASGIQDVILTKLAAIADLHVTSRTSTKRYQSHPADLRTVAAELGVAAVLEGSVQKIGDQVLINVQLIDGREGRHLWAESYTRSLDRVFEIEKEIAEHVAAALKATLLPAEATRLARTPTGDAQAYDAFLKAEYLVDEIGRESARDMNATAREARALYRQAIERDPQFALAWARLSYLESQAYLFHVDYSPRTIAAADEAAARALALEPDLAQAHVAHGYALYYGHLDHDAAIAAFERARRGSPGDGEIDAAIGNVLRRQGRTEAAVAQFEKAAGLDPRNPRWPMLLGDALVALHRYDEGERAYDRALAADPRDPAPKVYKALGQLAAGRLDEARRTLDALPDGYDLGGLATALRFEIAMNAHDADAALAALAQAPDWLEAVYMTRELPTDLLRAQAWELKGDAARAQRAYRSAHAALRALAQDHPDDPSALSLLGLAAAGLGDAGEALRAARRAVERLPVERDASDGPLHLAALAVVESRVGDPGVAAGYVRELLRMPAGRIVSAALAERDPRFAGLRVGAEPR